MTVKRSQNFLYFQNKAQHYRNIELAQPKINDRPTHHYHTLQPSTSRNRGLSYNRQYQINVQNKKLNNRILSISHSHHSHVGADGGYVRFNKFQRSFRKKNPFKEQQQRKLQLQNDSYSKRISEIKPRVGLNSVWLTQFNQKQQIKKLMSRYDQEQKAKQNIKIDGGQFLLNPYSKYIDHLSQSNSSNKLNLEGSNTSKSRMRHIKIQKQQLFVLPPFGTQQKNSENYQLQLESDFSKLRKIDHSDLNKFKKTQISEKSKISGKE